MTNKLQNMNLGDSCMQILKDSIQLKDVKNPFQKKPAT